MNDHLAILHRKLDFFLNSLKKVEVLRSDIGFKLSWSSLSLKKKTLHVKERRDGLLVHNIKARHLSEMLTT